jgi:phosphoribosyl 1,2-cyclic phosphate phosphodiesterase
MRVIVLGCGGSAGVPMIGGADGRGDWGLCDPDEPRNRRTRSSIVIESEGGERLLIDTGPDLRDQLLTRAVPMIDAILFTHAHADHVCGIDEVRSLNRIADRPLEAYAFPETLDELRERFSFAFLPWSPPGFYRPVLTASAVRPGEVVRIAGLELTVFEQVHGRIRTLGFRIGGFAYSTDVVELGREARRVLEGVDTWMVDAFQREPHSSHAHLDLALAWGRELGVRRTILTHMGTDLDWGWLGDRLPDGVEPAFDGMKLDFRS